MTDVRPSPRIEREYSPILRPRPGIASLERARGHARLALVAVGADTRLAECYQSGSAKIRLPRGAATGGKEAVLLNTAGGVTGGDHIVYEISVGAGGHAVVSTQAAERVYRRAAGEARLETKIMVGAGARLDWLPQETILFDNSALSRRLDADVAADATLLAVEAILLGRTAMGETASKVRVSDTWRVRRDGQLIYADGLRLDGSGSAIMSGGATGGGAVALATVFLVAPEAENLVEAAREALGRGDGEGGASAWNGMLVARLLARSGRALRSDLVALVERLRGCAMPRMWNC